MPLAPTSLAPFLYPSWTSRAETRLVQRLVGLKARSFCRYAQRRTPVSAALHDETPDRLNPTPDDYGRQIFADKCRLALHAGSGGNGCVSFLREKFIAEGPPNGGDGGSGGNIFIQAVPGETSLHKLARQGTYRAGRGKNGQGKSKGGQRGEDILLQVPVGTVVREISRLDPVALEEKERTLSRGEGDEDQHPGVDERRWVFYPDVTTTDVSPATFPALPRPRRSHLTALQPEAPIRIDLSQPMEEPRLLVAGAMGGMGNPHFVTRAVPRPKYATKGSRGMRLEIELELKLLADLGFVGFPNAGKSTLLRALSRSRARVGDWAFTTLQPNIGTVVLDNNKGPARLQAFDADGKRRSQFSIADIPGIVRDAHKDRGLGLDFLRHIERAQVLAFVVDLSNGDSVEMLKVLWRELDQFEKIKVAAGHEAGSMIENWDAFGSSPLTDEGAAELEAETTDELSQPPAEAQPEPFSLPTISTRPWFVVATKADLDGTQDNFLQLQSYLKAVSAGEVEHPAGPGERWKGTLKAIPVSGLRGEGVDTIPKHTVSLLGGAMEGSL